MHPKGASRKTRNLLLGIVGVALFMGMLVYMTVGEKQHTVEVCMAYNGQQSCRAASASTEQQALRTAIENACATISAGMTDTMACERTRPLSVKKR